MKFERQFRIAGNDPNERISMIKFITESDSEIFVIQMEPHNQQGEK